MKRALILLLTVFLALSWATAQAVTPMHLTAKDARSVAMGDAFTALASGYQSLYGNPASFGVGRGMLTLANASVWGYIRPTTKNINDLTSMDFSNSTGTSAAIGTLNNLITQNGLGAGAAAGLGFTGGGLGLGVTMVSEEYARGNSLFGTNFTSATQANAVVGLAITLGTKTVGIKVGGDLRPFLRIEGSFPAITMITAMMGNSSTGGSSNPLDVLNNQPALYGLGLAADLGAIINLGSLSAGLSIRDIAPPFKFYSTNFGVVINGGNATANDRGITGQFVPDVTLGLGWTPKFIPGIIDPAVYFEVKDAINVIKNNSSLFNLLHIGGELRLLSFVYLRGGMDQGWLSAGAGINLLILEADVAAFTDELSKYPGNQGRSGIAANLRLHF
jgi:hypothetical protein